MSRRVEHQKLRELVVVGAEELFEGFVKMFAFKRPSKLNNFSSSPFQFTHKVQSRTKWCPILAALRR